MNNSFLKKVTVVFIVLAVVALLPWLYEKMNTGKSDVSGKSSVDFSDYSKDTVEKIIIKKGEEEKALIKENGVWRIGEDEIDIDGLFADLSGAKIVEIVSRNESNYAKFEVEKDKGIELRIIRKGKENLYWVGKESPSASEFYVRKDGMKNVYLAEGNLRETLLKKESEWKKQEKKEEQKSEVKQN